MAHNAAIQHAPSDPGLVAPPSPRPPDAAELRQLVDAATISKRLGVAESTVRLWALNDDLPCLKLGPRMLRFDPAAVDLWLATRNNGAEAAYFAAVARLVETAPKLTRTQADVIATLLTRGGGDQ